VADTAGRETGLVEPTSFLVIDRSQMREGLWRFGRADESRALSGRIERNDVGGLEVTQPQGEAAVWRDDRTTALCLVATQSDEWRIEYDLSWRPAPPIPPGMRLPIPVRAEEHRMTLGERAEMQRRSTDRRVNS
jgi:hypothetical protein